MFLINCFLQTNDQLNVFDILLFLHCFLQVCVTMNCDVNFKYQMTSSWNIPLLTSSAFSKHSIFCLQSITLRFSYNWFYNIFLWPMQPINVSFLYFYVLVPQLWDLVFLFHFPQNSSHEKLHTTRIADLISLRHVEYWTYIEPWCTLPLSLFRTLFWSPCQWIPQADRNQ